MTAVDFAAVKAVQLSTVVGQSVKLKRSGQEWVGLCPFHDEQSPSFTVNDAKGFYHCFGCGSHGDAADFVAGVAGCGLREAAERLGVGNLPVMTNLPRAGPLVDKTETIDAARRIWRGAAPINGTPAEHYLWKRGIHAPLPPTLRFARLHHYGGGVHPCLVAVAISPEQTFAGIQRTYLSDAGVKASVQPVKMSLGKIRGCSIRLTPPAAEMIVCEGIEDGMTLLQELGRSVWVAAGASMLPSMRFPPVVQSVVIAADNDTAGERETEKAAAAFADRGLAVRVMRPESGVKDFNEQLTSRAGRRAAS